jgi:hypothetical protein
MPLPEYAANVDRILRSLCLRFAEDRVLFNVPGRSVACKVDESYYLCVEPGFVNAAARCSVMFPSRVRESLVRTGNMISSGPNRTSVLEVCVNWPGGETIDIRASFVLADYLERGLRVYARLPEPLPLSGLRICDHDRSRVERFFVGKTPPSGLAYGGATVGRAIA